MEIEKSGKEEVVLKLKGRLDTVSAPKLESEIDELQCKSLVLDLQELEYTSSAGLRIFLKASKKLNGNIRIINISDEVRVIINMTGFDKILGI